MKKIPLCIFILLSVLVYRDATAAPQIEVVESRNEQQFDMKEISAFLAKYKVMFSNANYYKKENILELSDVNIITKNAKKFSASKMRFYSFDPAILTKENYNSIFADKIEIEHFNFTSNEYTITCKNFELSNISGDPLGIISSLENNKEITSQTLRKMLLTKFMNGKFDNVHIEYSGLDSYILSADNITIKDYANNKAEIFAITRAHFTSQNNNISCGELYLTGITFPQIEDWLAIFSIPDSVEDIFMRKNNVLSSEDWLAIIFSRYHQIAPLETCEIQKLHCANQNSYGLIKIDSAALGLKFASLPGGRTVIKDGEWTPPKGSIIPPVSFSCRADVKPSADTRLEVESFSCKTSLASFATRFAYDFPELDFDLWRRKPVMLLTGTLEEGILRIEDDGLTALLARNASDGWIKKSVRYLVSALNDSSASQETEKILLPVVDFLEYPKGIQADIKPRVKIPLRALPEYIIQSPNIVNVVVRSEKGNSRAFTLR